MSESSEIENGEENNFISPANAEHPLALTTSCTLQLIFERESDGLLVELVVRPPMGVKLF